MTNLVILAGNIGQQPTSRSTQNGTRITNFNLATSRNVVQDGKTLKDENGYTVKDTQWHRITCFAGLADTIDKYCDKGMKVQVQGRIQYQKWTDRDGIERYSTEIIAEKVEFLSRMEKSQAEPKTKGKKAKAAQSPAMYDLDDEVPF